MSEELLKRIQALEMEIRKINGHLYEIDNDLDDAQADIVTLIRKINE